MEDIAGRIEREVASWAASTTRAHRFGGVEFRLGRRESPPARRAWPTSRSEGIRDMLVETAGSAAHVLPDGLVSPADPQ